MKLLVVQNIVVVARTLHQPSVNHRCTRRYSNWRVQDRIATRSTMLQVRSHVQMLITQSLFALTCLGRLTYFILFLIFVFILFVPTSFLGNAHDELS